MRFGRTRLFNGPTPFLNRTPSSNSPECEVTSTTTPLEPATTPLPQVLRCTCFYRCHWSKWWTVSSVRCIDYILGLGVTYVHNLLALFSPDFSTRKKSKLFTLYTCNLLLILMKQTTCCYYIEINISLFRLHCTPSSAARACIWKRMKVECSKLRRAGCSELGCLDKHLKRDGRWIVIKLRRTIWWEGGR